MSGDDMRLRLLWLLGRFIYPTYRFKWPQMDWLHDANFNRFLAQFGESNGFDTERRWMIKELMRLTQSVPGDTAECGSYKGAGSYLICEMNAASTAFKRHHHIFDSFEGLSAPKPIDGPYWSAGRMAFGADVVRKNLAKFASEASAGNIESASS